VTSFDFNKALKNILDFVIIYFKPSLAKVIIWPILVAGIGFLYPSIWVDVVNWVIENQTRFIIGKLPDSPPDITLGIGLILLSIFVYIIDAIVQVAKIKHENNGGDFLDEIKEIPGKTVEEIVEKIAESGFLSPHLQDERITTLISEITALRFFGMFPTAVKSKSLARSILDGELKGGTSPIKANALALIARYLCSSDNIVLAKTLLIESRRNFDTKEAKVAEVFIEVYESDSIDSVYSLSQDPCPLYYSATFMLKRIKKGSSEALNWFNAADLKINNLDTDGQISFIGALLETENWERALSEVSELNCKNSINSPALTNLLALTYLTNAIQAVELRQCVMQAVPLSSDSFPLSDDNNSIKLRTEAISMFKLCSSLARNIGANDVAELAGKYALWLELRNTDTRSLAIEKLNCYFSDSDISIKALEYIPLAFSFGIKLNYSTVEEATNKQTALLGDSNPTLGAVRFVLAHKQNDYIKCVEYINTHRKQIEKFANPVAIKIFEIEALAKAGLVEDAEIKLLELERSGNTTEVKSLKSIIASVNGGDPIVLAISQYTETNSIDDLVHLVALLENSGLKEKFRSSSLDLFNLTGSEVHALNVANAFSGVLEFLELEEFLIENFDLVERSTGLMSHWAWVLFRRGDFFGAKNYLDIIQNRNDHDIDLQQLEINLAIYSGNWDALTVIVESKWENRNNLNPNELMQAAQLAKAQSPRRAKDILEYATDRFSDNSDVMASSYLTATTLGWEDSSKGDWLNKAIILSNDSGLLHKASLEDLKNMMSDQRTSDNEIYKVYEDGGAPLFTIVKLLNRTLSDIYLIKAIENMKATDIRKRFFIGAFHSARSENSITEKIISIDPSSVLVLGYLNLLDLFFEAFDEVVIPHSLMRWLYDDKQKIAFHQPSQIQKAKAFESLVSDAYIKIIEPTGITNPELALDVGDELAFLVEKASEGVSGDRQVLVSCSYPVYKVGGRNKKVDLSRYENNLTSCTSLVEKLKDIEAITTTECENSLSYLARCDNKWPLDAGINDDAIIYLDSLSVTYLMTIGLLDKFKGTGIEIFVHDNNFSYYKGLRGLDSIIEQADDKIEKIRNELFSAIQTNKVIFSSIKYSQLEKESANDSLGHPTVEMFEALAISDAGLVDDRFINKYENVAGGEKTVSIYTSLDFIETLYDNKSITEEQKYSYLTKLRMSGFGFIPVSIKELNCYLAASKVVGGFLRPTKELKIIKENISLLKIHRVMRLPRDELWLQGILRNFSRALKDQWSNDISCEISCIRSNWIIKLLDLRTWADCMDVRHEEGMAYSGERIRASILLTAPVDLSESVKKSYYDWLDEAILSPLKESNVAGYESLIDTIKTQVEALVINGKHEGSSSDNY
jgi:hypothetical protein